MQRILSHSPVMTIRLHPNLARHAIAVVRVALFAIIVVFAVLDIAIAVLLIVAIWAWSQFAEGAQS